MGEDLLLIKFFFFFGEVGKMEYRLGKHFFKLAYVEQRMPNSQINYYCFLDTVGNIFLSILLCWLFHSLLPITGRHLNFFLQSNKGCIKRKVKQDRAQKFTFRISFWHLLECMEPMNHNIVSQAVKIGLWTFSEMESVTKAHIKAVGGIYFNSYNFLVSWNSVLN